MTEGRQLKQEGDFQFCGDALWSSGFFATQIWQTLCRLPIHDFQKSSSAFCNHKILHWCLDTCSNVIKAQPSGFIPSFNTGSPTSGSWPISEPWGVCNRAAETAGERARTHIPPLCKQQASVSMRPQFAWEACRRAWCLLKFSCTYAPSDVT